MKKKELIEKIKSKRKVIYAQWRTFNHLPENISIEDFYKNTINIGYNQAIQDVLEVIIYGE